MLLTSLGPLSLEHENSGDVGLGRPGGGGGVTQAIVTEFDARHVHWLIRARTAGAMEFTLDYNGTQTAMLTSSTTPNEMQAALETLPDLAGNIERVEGLGDQYGPIDASVMIGFAMWWVTMKPEWEGAFDGSSSPFLASKYPLDVASGQALVHQTMWKLTDHVETVRLPWGVEEQSRYLQGSLVIAQHWPDAGYIVTTPECYRFD